VKAKTLKASPGVAYGLFSGFFYLSYTDDFGMRAILPPSF
jgi:hypothetical protein